MIESTSPSTRILESGVPSGPLESAWDQHLRSLSLMSASNKKNRRVLVVGTGLAGASVAASLAEQGYQVLNFCIQDSPRRAHSVAAQGGINAAKNYRNDGDSTYRLFYETVKGGDYRSREQNVYRLAQVSNAIIDHCVAQGVPFAREYGGLLANRSFGGTQVSRTFYARGQTGQQLLLGAYGALMRQVDAGGVTLLPRREMLDLVVVDGKARGILCRNLVTGAIEAYAGEAVLLCTGGYSGVYYLSTNAVNSNATAMVRCYRRGALLANPCFTQIHPTCIPPASDAQAKQTLMSESLRNDGRVWVSASPGDRRAPADIPEAERDYFLERMYPAFGNLVPRDIASRAAKRMCDDGHSASAAGNAVYLDFTQALDQVGRATIAERYGNLFKMYEECTGDDPYRSPMKIYPAPHYSMGGLWVDYNLMSTIPGLFVLGEANFSDHGANRLGASALMQGLADGYFIAPSTVTHYLASTDLSQVTTRDAAFLESEAALRRQVDDLLAVKGDKTVRTLHQELGRIMWDRVGMSRSRDGLQGALQDLRSLRDLFRSSVNVPGSDADFNKSLEMAGRLADYIDLGELMTLDALQREESCGAHFREEHQTATGEARRNDEQFTFVAAWEWQDGQDPSLHKETLTYESVGVQQRNYV